MLIGNSFRSSTMFMATGRLPLQNPITLEGDVGTTIGSRKKSIPRLHLPQPNQLLLGFIE